MPRFIAWYPRGLEPELAAVMVPQGSVVTEWMWWDALADRVTELVLRDPEPEEAAKWACRALRVAGGDSPQEAGQFLVLHNLELHNALSLILNARKSPFPATVRRGSAMAREAVEQISLENWIDYAEPYMRPSGCD